MSMKILTLTTDFGREDFYLSLFKGLILSRLSDVSIVDVSHETEPFHIQTAAYNLKNAWKHFPENSLHVLRVGESARKAGRFLAMKVQQQYFLLPDNGVITLMFDQLPVTIIALQNKDKSVSNSVFLANAIAHILKQNDIESLGEETTHFQERISQQPILSTNYIRGIVQHIDRYGNVITNIDDTLFYDQVDEREFEIMTRAVSFHKIMPSYASVQPGNKLACFNSAGYLQLSINQGNAAELFGLSISDTIQIDFL